MTRTFGTASEQAPAGKIAVVVMDDPEGGRGGERACHTGQQRSLTVNNGYSKPRLTRGNAARSVR